MDRCRGTRRGNFRERNTSKGSSGDKGTGMDGIKIEKEANVHETLRIGVDKGVKAQTAVGVDIEERENVSKGRCMSRCRGGIRSHRGSQCTGGVDWAR